MSSVRQDSTSVTIVTPSAHCGLNLTTGQHCMVSEDGDGEENYEHNIQDVHLMQHLHGQECKLSSGGSSNADKPPKGVQSVHMEPEYISTEPRDSEGNTGEVVLMVVSTQTQAPKEHQSLMVPYTGLEAQREASWQGEGGITALGASGGPMEDEPTQEQIKLNNNNHDLEACSSQSRMFLQDSSVIFSGETPHYECSTGPAPLPHPSDPSHVSFDHQQVYSHAVTETRDRTAPSPWLPSQSRGPNPIPPRPPSVQSLDCLPTFTSQRPVDLLTAMGKQALSNTLSAYIPSTYDHR